MRCARVRAAALAALSSVLLLSSVPGAAAGPDGPPEEFHDEALAAADFILSLQNEHGAIADHPNAGIANTDSHMEYAMMALGSAYEATADPRYLDAIGRGLVWLRDRQRSDGSWWISYASNPPFRENQSVYGVSATVGLFAYTVWLYGFLGGDPFLVESLLPAVQRGMDFVYARMRARDGTFYSSIPRHPDETYRVHTYRFTSDQADMYLGLRAAGALLGRARYTLDAWRVRKAVLQTDAFFFTGTGRFAKGILPNGKRDGGRDLLMVWPQGYVPWVLGSNGRTRAAVNWLRAHQLPDGSVKGWPDDPIHTLSAQDLVMGTLGVMDGATDEPADRANIWLANVVRDPASGALINGPGKPTRFCNIAGFGVISWLGSRMPIPPPPTAG